MAEWGADRAPAGLDVEGLRAWIEVARLAGVSEQEIHANLRRHLGFSDPQPGDETPADLQPGETT